MCFSANEPRHGGAKGKEAALTPQEACCRHTTAEEVFLWPPISQVYLHFTVFKKVQKAN